MLSSDLQSNEPKQLLDPKCTEELVLESLLTYLYETNAVAAANRPLPLDESLLELGILDSFGVVELVAFLEKKWAVRIYDSELTREKFGSLRKMAVLVGSKLVVGRTAPGS